MSQAAHTSDTLSAAERAVVALRGVGQVMFQEHAGTGFCFLLGILAASPWMCLGAVVGALLSPAVGRALRVDRAQLAAGLYGFNSVLVGIALLFYLEARALTWLLVVLGSVLAALVTWMFHRFASFPAYTAPFVLTTWVCLEAARLLPIDARPPPPAATQTLPWWVNAVLNGEAEVMFGANPTTGLLFLIGIALSNRRHAVAALLGAVLGTLVAAYRHDPESSIWVGLYGYNASLAAMAAYLARPGLLAPLLATIATVPLVDWAGAAWGVPALTAPFVLATWLVLLLLAAERRLTAPAGVTS